jgi:prepilin-type N-terminal cleavage/methylation domain-containing protein
MKKHNKTRGFSLVELLVVVAIIAIIASIATVCWMQWQGHRQTHFSEDRLISTLNNRRSIAINSHTSYKCHVKENTLVCQNWTRNKQGYAGWHNDQTVHIAQPEVNLEITRPSQTDSHALYFLSSGDVPPFTLLVKQGNKVLYQLKSNGVAVVRVAPPS